MTATAETDAVLRRLRQATESAERLSTELVALREWSDETARLDLARALTGGPDGGALGLVVTLASDDQDSDPALRRVADSLLHRLTSSLGLQPIGERGEHLSLLPEERGEFEVRGAPGDARVGETRQLFRVIRPGWLLGSHIVERPLVESVERRDA